MEKQKERRGTSKRDDIFDISEDQLDYVLESYLEETEEKPKSPRLLNFTSVTGLVFLAVCFFAVIQLIFPFNFDFTPLLNMLPVIGGIMVVLTGLGIFGRDRKKKQLKKKKLAEMKARTREQFSTMSDSGVKGSDDFDQFAFKKKRKLYRARYDKKIFGICGGLARYLGIDSTLVRILFVAFFLIGQGTPLIAYIVLAMLLDKEPPKLHP